jgi:ATPase subunit of ABC transporter with duplicated ATPase domains
MGFKLSIVLGLALVAMAGGFKLYYDKSEAEKQAMAMQLQQAMNNQQRLENAIATQNEQIKKALAEQKASQERIQSLTLANNKANEKVEDLRNKFARHDLDMLSIRKPGLVEKIVNRGTAQVFADLQRLTDPNQFDEEVISDTSDPS